MRGRQGSSSWFEPLDLGAPTLKDAGRIPGADAREASVVPLPPVETVYVPGVKLTVTSAVPCGLIGPVSASGCELEDAGAIASDSALPAWLVTMNTTGPAPIEAGDTETRSLLTYTVTLTGAGGRGWFAKVVPPPQPATTRPAKPRNPIVVLRILIRGPVRSPYSCDGEV